MLIHVLAFSVLDLDPDLDPTWYKKLNIEELKIKNSFLNLNFFLQNINFLQLTSVN